MPRSETPLRSDLFPEISPYASGMLAVDGRHTIYWEQSGNPEGVPVVFLHGGPGAGSAPVHRRFFDPQFYRIVVFDQRGCGRSVPLGELHDNTTTALVADMEKLRKHLGIPGWLLFGGSWGSTLALAYGLAHPERATGFILRGIFLGARPEIDWFLHGMRTIFPEAWRDFAGHLPEEERSDLLGNYYRRLIDRNPDLHRPAARAWSRYEAACSTLYPTVRAPFDTDHGGFALALSRIDQRSTGRPRRSRKPRPFSTSSSIRALSRAPSVGRGKSRGFSTAMSASRATSARVAASISATSGAPSGIIQSSRLAISGPYQAAAPVCSGGSSNDMMGFPRFLLAQASQGNLGAKSSVSLVDSR